MNVTPVTFTRDGIIAGMRVTAPMAVSVAVYGVVFGVLARQVGISLLETVLMNLIVFAGAAQLAALDSWVYPLPILALVITVLLVNMRLIMLGAALRPWMRSLPNRIVYPTMYVLNDEAWAVVMTRYRMGERDAGVVLGGNLVVYLAWNASVVAGHLLGSQVGDPSALGLDFAFTAVFAAMLFGGYRSRYDLVPWATSGLVAWLVWWLVPGTWYVIAGGLAGFAIAWLRSERPLPATEPDVDGSMP
jgi:4-azaleucine resistance transporter AzlC